MEAASSLSFRHYNEHGVLVSDGIPPSFAEFEEYRSLHQQVVESLAVPKPEWFNRAERSARSLLKEIGLSVQLPVYMLGEDDLLDSIGFRESETTVGQVDVFLPYALIRKKEMMRRYIRYGPVEVRAVLVHEMIHQTLEPVDTVYIRDQAAAEPTELYRSGFMTHGPAGEQGTFYEEGLAEYFAGWMRRRATDERAPLFDATKRPIRRTVPAHYAHISTEGKMDDAYVAGPDGYAIELMARAVDERGIANGEEFIYLMLATRIPELRTDALREFAQYVEQLQPGLYASLRRLRYGKQQWRGGLRLVLNAVQTKGKNNG